MLSRTIPAIIALLALPTTPFSPLQTHTPRNSPVTSTSLQAVVPPGGTVGIVGRGYVPLLCAKLASIAGYDTWMIVPAGEEEKVQSLVFGGSEEEGDFEGKLEFIGSVDTDAVEERLGSTNAVMFAVDDDSTLADTVVEFILNGDTVGGKEGGMERVVTMSRNLNGKGLGFLSKASKISANTNVWHNDGESVKLYRDHERKVKDAAAAVGAEYTIARAGTLKGGGCGDLSEYSTIKEESCPQFLGKAFYDYEKRDIINWNLLFDCSSRGVTLTKGDVMEGPGIKAVFTATAPQASIGDTSRSGIAEAMVKSLSMENAGNADFGIAAAEGRAPPTDAEWEALFQAL